MRRPCAVHERSRNKCTATIFPREFLEIPWRNFQCAKTFSCDTRNTSWKGEEIISSISCAVIVNQCDAEAERSYFFFDSSLKTFKKCINRVCCDVEIKVFTCFHGLLWCRENQRCCPSQFLVNYAVCKKPIEHRSTTRRKQKSKIKTPLTDAQHAQKKLVNLSINALLKKVPMNIKKSIFTLPGKTSSSITANIILSNQHTEILL